MEFTRQPIDGYFKAPDDVFDQGFSMKAGYVYLFLCRMADADGRSWPKLDTIAEACGTSKRSVISALRELEDACWISRESQRHLALPTIYTVLHILVKPRKKAGNNCSPTPEASNSCSLSRQILPEEQAIIARQEGLPNEGIKGAAQSEDEKPADPDWVTETLRRSGHLVESKEEGAE